MSRALTAILCEVQELLNRTGNDFSWSSWKNAEEAVAEIQAHSKRIEHGDYSCVSNLEMLFAPTGPIQEASMSSGWAWEYLAIAQRFDEEIKKLGLVRSSPDKTNVAEPGSAGSACG